MHRTRRTVPWKASLAFVLGVSLLLPAGVAPAFAEDTGPAEPAVKDAPAERGVVAEHRAAYEKGLAYLRGAEEPGGGWGIPGRTKGAEPGITALVLTGFLRRPGGVDPRDRERIRAGLDFLLSLQKEDGGIHQGSNANYTTCVAVAALVASGDAAHRPAVDRAVGFLRRMQFCEDGAEGRVVERSDERYGGMGYGSDPTHPDLSNSQFAADSLRAAGVPSSDPALQRLVVFLNRTQNRRENETEGEPRQWRTKDGKTVVRSSDGGGIYAPGNSKAGVVEQPDGTGALRSYGSMTYALLKCYLHAGVGKDDPRVKDAVQWIRDHYTFRENPGFDSAEQAMQGYFYYLSTAARALAMLGDDAAGLDGNGTPRDWRGDLARELLSRQKKDGSWANDNDRWMEKLPVLATSFALQALAETTR